MASASDDFAEFVTASLPALRRLGHMISGSSAAGDDLVQSALASTLSAWPRVRRHEDPFGYVRRTMINENVSTWRRWGARAQFGRVPDQVRDDTANIADRLAVVQALAALPPRQRTVLVLRYYCEMTELEIAAEMNCRPGTVKSQAARGLAALRRVLTEDEPSFTSPAGANL